MTKLLKKTFSDIPFRTVMSNLVESAPQATYALMNSRLLLLKGLSPIRQWLGQQINRLEIRDAAMAHLICRIIPAQCPFERSICLFGRFTVHIPPLCKLNPLYEEVIGLRFRGLSHLADEGKEDVSCY